MQQELIMAINDEREEYETLKRQNDDLQRRIYLMDNKSNEYEKQSEQMLNEHKYLNTLANVHQVRFNLKETQDRYNRMASELQAKLNEKQAKCQEIEAQFKALKNSVAKNAVFSRTGKKLKESVIEQWEGHEALKDQEVHQYRLQNISLRNRHDNLDKIYKKKEQLADGLHLIDFEQLKIENQTLNEKIEERNEELHKLKKKITTTVVILSHTREKYQFIVKQNERKNEELAELTNELTKIKTRLSKLKRQREKFAKKFQKLKQLTGIVSQHSLKVDFQNRTTELKKLEKEIKELDARHQHLNRKIEQARQIQSRGYAM
jgi:chromosome segregation ATPase